MASLVLLALTVGLVGYPLVRMAVAEDRAALRHVLEREVDTGTLTGEELRLSPEDVCVRRGHFAAARTPQERAWRAASLEARAHLDTIRAATPGCRHDRSGR